MTSGFRGRITFIFFLFILTAIVSLETGIASAMSSFVRDLAIVISPFSGLS